MQDGKQRNHEAAAGDGEPRLVLIQGEGRLDSGVIDTSARPDDLRKQTITVPSWLVRIARAPRANHGAGAREGSPSRSPISFGYGILLMGAGALFVLVGLYLAGRWTRLLTKEVPSASTATTLAPVAHPPPRAPSSVAAPEALSVPRTEAVAAGTSPSAPPESAPRSQPPRRPASTYSKQAGEKPERPTTPLPPSGDFPASF